MASVGAYLRDLRTRRGVSLEEIARLTRVAPRYLEALEADASENLPAPVFIRGFIRAYCQALGESPKEALAIYEGHDVHVVVSGARPGSATRGTAAGATHARCRAGQLRPAGGPRHGAVHGGARDPATGPRGAVDRDALLARRRRATLRRDGAGPTPRRPAAPAPAPVPSPASSRPSAAVSGPTPTPPPSRTVARRAGRRRCRTSTRWAAP